MEANSLQGILTRHGVRRIASYTAGEGEKIEFVTAAVGDGGGEIPPADDERTELVREVWRGAVNSVQLNPQDPNDIIIDLVIPNEVGGFVIREWGLFDEEGALVAVGPHAEMYKPEIGTGQTAEFIQRFHLKVSNIAAITLVISSAALATHEQVVLIAAALIAEHNADRHAHAGMLNAGQSYRHYTIPVTDPSGLVRIVLAELEHPAQTVLFNPVINLLTASFYAFCIKSRSTEEFTVQIFRMPDGTPGVNVVQFIELGTFELGEGVEVGAPGDGAGAADVTLLVSIPV